MKHFVGIIVLVVLLIASCTYWQYNKAAEMSRRVCGDWLVSDAKGIFPQLGVILRPDGTFVEQIRFKEKTYLAADRGVWRLRPGGVRLLWSSSFSVQWADVMADPSSLWLERRRYEDMAIKQHSDGTFQMFKVMEPELVATKIAPHDIK